MNLCNKIWFKNILVGMLIMYSSNASTNHSSAMFDKTEVVMVNATIKEFQWANPHVWIQIYIHDEVGERIEWSIEGIGINTLFRRGWRPNSFIAGDIIQIQFNPMIDGSHAGAFIGAKFENGKILGRWNNKN